MNAQQLTLEPHVIPLFSILGPDSLPTLNTQPGSNTVPNLFVFFQIKECSRFQPGTGDVVPCLVENKDGIKNTRCKHVVNKLAQIMFSDYRLLKDFYQDCKEDVAKFECGMQDAMEKGVSNLGGQTLFSSNKCCNYCSLVDLRCRWSFAVGSAK